MIPLPDEIYLYILESLPDLATFTHKKDFQDYRQISATLASACQVNRAFRAFAEPLLYRAYIEDEEDDSRRRSSEAGECTRLQLYLRTLIHRPDLAAKVEYLRLADCIDYPDIKPYAVLFAEAVRNLCTSPHNKSGSQRNLEWQSDWKDGLRGHRVHQDAEVALLLALLPNIGNLDIYASRRNYGRFVGLLCKSIEDPESWIKETQTEDDKQVLVFKAPKVSSALKLPFFPRLSMLTLEGAKHWTIGFLKDIACLPSLESLCLYGVHVPLILEGVTPFRLPLQNIRNLTLKDCIILDIHMQSIINSCGSLRSLRIKRSPNLDETSIGLNMDALIKCLVSSSDTLEELQIYMPKPSPGYNGTTRAETFDLRSFTRLRTIEINMEFLFPPTSDTEPSFIALLPTSIDDLYLRMADKRFAKHLRVLAEEFKDFPKLKTVDIGIDDMPSIHAMDQAEVDWKLALNDCATKLRNGGIECSVPVEGTHFNLSCGND